MVREGRIPKAMDIKIDYKDAHLSKTIQLPPPFIALFK
jgi:hypothetical protein